MELTNEDRQILINVLYRVQLTVSDSERVLAIINKLKGQMAIDADKLTAEPRKEKK